MKLPTVLGFLNFNFSIEIEKITRTSSAKFAASNGSYLKIRIDHPNLKLQAGLETPLKAIGRLGVALRWCYGMMSKKNGPSKWWAPTPMSCLLYTVFKVSGSGRLMITARDGSVHVMAKWQNHENSRQFTSRDAKMTNLKTGDSKKKCKRKKWANLGKIQKKLMLCLVI